VLGFLKLRDVFAGILERDELVPAGQRDWIVEGSRHPLLWLNGALSASVLKPFGIRGAVSSSVALHRGHGALAPPQVHACSPSHGLSG
jgi:hypothetical protein